MARAAAATCALSQADVVTALCITVGPRDLEADSIDNTRLAHNPPGSHNESIVGVEA